MKKLRRILPWFAALLALALLIFMLQHFADKDDETAAVILPPPATQSGNDGSGDAAASQLTVAGVTKETLVEVLRELSRADSYSRELTVETFWAEGSGTETLSVWVKGDALRVTSGRKNILLSGGQQWLWYTDDSRVLTGEQAVREQADRYMRMLSYEALLDGDYEILDAGYMEFGEEACIFASYRDGAFGYRSDIYVSVANGLLIAAETYDGETCVYRMTSGPVDISTPDDALLTPPV